MSGGQRGTRKRRAAIVGAGFGGLGAAIRLQQQGLMDFEIFERGASAGGVWRANTYPGAACDVPSHYYSLSFAPGHRWSRRFAPQTEILDYLKGLVDEFGLAPYLHLNTEVTSAQFDQARGLWTVETGDGQSREFDVLITACGQLTNPTIPALPGLEQFAGESFHSAYWNRDVALAGKRVAVIGTGASAIQFVPEIAPQVGHLDIYQRSASWILPKPDRSYPEWERKLFRRFPLRVAAARAGFFAAYDLLTYAFTGNRMAGNVIRKLADGYRNYALKGRADLIDKMTPHYDIGCKRLLLTNDWYPALRRDNVALHHGKLQGITANGVIGPDGVERAVDVIIWGTGFDTGGFVAPMKI
jgi:cation diffusion facilitator CzcD-associated flavoprotein CzcO